jgi:hypothetical protein
MVLLILKLPGALGKMIVFSFSKREGKLYIEMIPDARKRRACTCDS